MQIIQNALKNNKTAIVLVPEISLTPQMVDRFLARFGACIAKIVIGARSAIFAPVENLGVIIIDEEHDSSYKSDMAPRYKAQDIAKYLAKKNDIPLVLR